MIVEKKINGRKAKTIHLQKSYRTDARVKQRLKELFLFIRSLLREKQLLEKKWVFLFLYGVIFMFRIIWENSLLIFVQRSKKRRLQIKYWSIDARVCWEGKLNVATATNISLQFGTKELNHLYPLTFASVGAGSRKHENSPLPWLNSGLMLQRFPTACCWRSTAGRRKS